MFHLNAPPLPDDFVNFELELHHGRQVGGDSVCGPNFGMYDTVQRPAQLLDGPKADQRILAR